MGYGQSRYMWYIYSRDSETDSWNSLPLHVSDTIPIGEFKHMVWNFALQTTKNYAKYKALYLYHGNTRLAKAELLKPPEDSYYKLILECKDDSTAQNWDTCEEKIMSTGILWKESDFNNHYVPLYAENVWSRRWQLVKPMPDSKPGMPRLSLTDYIKSFY